MKKSVQYMLDMVRTKREHTLANRFGNPDNGKVYADRNGNKNDVFNASNIKVYNREANRLGRNPGDDSDYARDNKVIRPLDAVDTNVLVKDGSGYYEDRLVAPAPRQCLDCGLTNIKEDKRDKCPRCNSENLQVTLKEDASSLMRPHLTSDQKLKKAAYIKRLLLNKMELLKRYGSKKWRHVMNATANKMALGEEELKEAVASTDPNDNYESERKRTHQALDHMHKLIDEHSKSNFVSSVDPKGHMTQKAGAHWGHVAQMRATRQHIESESNRYKELLSSRKHFPAGAAILGNSASAGEMKTEDSDELICAEYIFETYDFDNIEEELLDEKIGHIEKGKLHRQIGMKQGKKIGKKHLRDLKSHGTKAEKKESNFALNMHKEEVVKDTIIDVCRLSLINDENLQAGLLEGYVMISPNEAEKILNVYEELSEENQNVLEEQIKTLDGYNKILEFANSLEEESLQESPLVAVPECPKCHRKQGERHLAKGKRPSINTLEKWSNDGVAKATDGCRVEPDGTCEHGHNSWMKVMGMI
jgi:Zn finger protein HypA/HybF involved in hydrogenase expression